MEKPTLKERFRYWLDTRLSSGSTGLIRILVVSTVTMIVLFSAVILLFGFNEDADAGSVIWDNIATIINAWMPASDEGSLGYRIIMALTAVAGLLFTSVLIGIVTSAMEEKIMGLKKGNSQVIEEDHTVVLGFKFGEYSLIRQLVLSAGDDKACIVIGADEDKEEMEQCIRDNVEIPKNVRIICRTVDIFDPLSIELLSVHTCRTVLISPMDDSSVVKSLLAVSSLIHSSDSRKVRVNAIVSKDQHRFPPSIARLHNMTTLQTNDTMAKIIAHSCTQTGLSEVFKEIFNFEGNELYLVKMEGIGGLSFNDLLVRMDRAVPAGIYRNHEMHLNPEPDTVLEETDRILVFAEENDSAVLREERDRIDTVFEQVIPERNTKVIIMGRNNSLKTVLKELPDNVEHVTFAGIRDEAEITERERKICEDREMTYDFDTNDLFEEQKLLESTRNAEHIIILSRHDTDPDESDMNTIFLLLNLRDIRSRYRLRYNITAEMRLESNQSLIDAKDHTDYIVASNMSSLFLAQLAESPRLIGAFEELLSNRGNELFMKKASRIHCSGTHTVCQLRQIIRAQGYIFLGYMNSDKEKFFNPPLDEVLEIKDSDRIIVLGES